MIRLLGSALLLVVAASFLIIHFCSALVVKHVMITTGTEMTGTAVEVGSLTFSPFTGKCEIRSLLIANPDDYASPHAILIDRIVLEISPGSYFQERKIVRKLLIDGVSVNSEKRGKTSNLEQLQQAAAAFQKKHPKKAKSQIDHFRLSGMRIHVKDVVTKGQDWELAPETVELRELGREEGELEAGEVIGKEIAKVVDEEVTKSGLRSKLTQIAIGNAVDGLKSGAAKIFGTVKSVLIGSDPQKDEENDGDERREDVDE